MFHTLRRAAQAQAQLPSSGAKARSLRAKHASTSSREAHSSPNVMSFIRSTAFFHICFLILVALLHAPIV